MNRKPDDVRRKLLAAALLCLTPLLSGPATAADATYRVDLIVFQDLWFSGSESGVATGAPNLQGALKIDDVAALKAAGIEILPDDQFGLDAEWKNIRYSKQFRPLVRLAWTQKNPPEQRGPALQIQYGADTAAPATAGVVGVVDNAGSAIAGPRVEGSVALLLSRYLHLDVKLQYVDQDSAWPIDERRRMRRDELHHLDSPRLGVLARVTKAAGADNDATQ